MHARAISVFTEPFETCSYRYAECFSALDHDRKNHVIVLWKHWYITVCKWITTVVNQ